MINKHPGQLPALFEKLLDMGVLSPEDTASAGDGFRALTKSLASILLEQGIDAYPDSSDQLQRCEYFFDDWFLYAVPSGDDFVYSLYKMREQEYDLEQGLTADGDTPGVTVSFVAFREDLLVRCLQEPAMANRKALGLEINRVVAWSGQKHHPVLKAYFLRPEARGPYWICDSYVRRIASFGEKGVLSVPKAYRGIWEKRRISKKYSRIPDFIDQNNQDAKALVCSHEKIFLRNPEKLTRFEKLAILATHTGNVSCHSFAAEIRYHALFLTPLAAVRIPFLGSPYASAIRADMSIADREFQGPAPYYNLTGRLVREQETHHGKIWE